MVLVSSEGHVLLAADTEEGQDKPNNYCDSENDVENFCGAFAYNAIVATSQSESLEGSLSFTGSRCCQDDQSREGRQVNCYIIYNHVFKS